MAEAQEFLNNGVEGDNPFFDLDEPQAAEPSTDEPQPQGPSAEQVTQWRQTHELVDRLRSDPQAMRHFVMQQAQTLGLNLQEPKAQPQQPSDPPADYVEQIRQTLSPETAFLAPQIAKATWQATQASMQPLRDKQAAHDAKLQQEEYASMAAALSQESPGWEKYEGEMTQILNFLRGALTGEGSMRHSKYGSALKVLYRLASGDAQATAQASRRMGEAARAATRTSQGNTRSGGPDLDTMLSKAGSPQQKWQLAMQHALREHGIA